MAAEKNDCVTPMKTVLITGVSRGCGRAMAVELARRGHTVIGIARSEDKLVSLRVDCPRPNGQQHLFTTVDVASDDGVKELARRVVDSGLVPDIVVNNAAIANKVNKIWELPSKEVDLVLDVNIKGTINVMRNFLPILIDRGHGLVVNISSLWGRTVAPNVASYCTSKWAIEGLSRAVAMEVPTGVVVVVLDPGVINTEMLASAFGSLASRCPTPEEWAPVAIEMILNLTVEDNGTSPTVIIDGKSNSTQYEITKEFIDSQTL